MLMVEAARLLWIPTQPLDSATGIRKRVSSCGAYSQAERNPCFRPEALYIGSSGIRCGNSRTASCHGGWTPFASRLLELKTFFNLNQGHFLHTSRWWWGGGGEERGGMVAAAGDKKGSGLGSVRAKT